MELYTDRAGVFSVNEKSMVNKKITFLFSDKIGLMAKHEKPRAEHSQGLAQEMLSRECAFAKLQRTGLKTLLYPAQ